MNLHEFRLIPSAGHYGPGVFDRGGEHKNLAEVDLVDRYVLPLKDELEQEGIRFSISPTRKAPGISLEDRTNLLEHIMPITCAMGFSRATKIKPSYNISTIYYGEDAPKRLYTLLSEVVGHWGALYVHGHKTAGAQPGGRGIRIEPFMINGPNVQEYARRLDRLGRDIGRAISDYCRQVGAGAFIAMTRGPAPTKAKAL